MMTNIPLFRHFMGGIYKILRIDVKDSCDGVFLVIYQNIDTKEIWARPVNEFFEILDEEKYSDATQVHRFEPYYDFEEETEIK